MAARAMGKHVRVRAGQRRRSGALSSGLWCGDRLSRVCQVLAVVLALMGALLALPSAAQNSTPSEALNEAPSETSNEAPASIQSPPASRLENALQATAPAGALPRAQKLSALQARRLFERIEQAARTLDYSGVVAYQQGSHLQSSRLVHVVDGSGERERIEVLDGRPREFLRHNEEVECLLPEQELVVRETYRGRRFPALFAHHHHPFERRAGTARGSSTESSAFFERYQVERLPGVERLAGRTCQPVRISPRDGWRYGYRLCVDSKTQLLLQRQTLTAAGTVVEQIAFSSLRLGRHADLTLLATPWPTQNWRVLESPLTPVELAARGWRLHAPAGFAPVAQVARRADGKQEVLQLLLSDGLASISVFIEPQPATADSDARPPLQGAGQLGAVNAYGAQAPGHWLLGLGEVPLATLQAVIDSAHHRPADSVSD